MTSVSLTTANTNTVRPVREPAFGDLLRSELTKIKTVRSTTWAFAAMVVLSLGFNILATSIYTSSWSTLSAADKASFQTDTIGLMLQPGAQFGQLAVCVLGVLLMASEYSTGMIRASVLASPRRTPILAAKAAVFAAITFVLAELVALPSFFIGSAITSAHASTSIVDFTSIRAILAFGVFMAAMGLIALAVGTIVRHPAGGISIVLGLQFVIPVVVSFIPGSLGNRIANLMPANATGMMDAASRANGDPSPLQSFGILVAWTAVSLAVAWFTLKRRDV